MLRLYTFKSFENGIYRRDAVLETDSTVNCTDGAEDAVVDGVVQEQYLGRLNKDGHQRQQAVCATGKSYTGGQYSEGWRPRTG